MKNRISIAMPAKNAEGTIKQALNSVLSSDLVGEVIIVDDGSSDQTAAKAQSLNDPRVVVVEGPATGAADALNTAIFATTGEFVARCDADDYFDESRLVQQLNFLMAEPEYIAVSGGFTCVTEKGNVASVIAVDGKPRDVTDELLNGNSVTTLCSWLIRGDVLRSHDGARPWFITSSDLDLQYRLAEVGKIWHIPKSNYFYRLHDASITHQQAANKRIFYQECATRFALQRRKSGKDDLMLGAPPVLVETGNTEAKKTSASKHVAGQFEGAAWRALSNGKRMEAIEVMVKSVRHDPLNLGRWISLVKVFAKSILPA